MLPVRSIRNGLYTHEQMLLDSIMAQLKAQAEIAPYELGAICEAMNLVYPYIQINAARNLTGAVISILSNDQEKEERGWRFIMHLFQEFVSAIVVRIEEDSIEKIGEQYYYKRLQIPAELVNKVKSGKIKRASA